MSQRKRNLLHPIAWLKRTRARLQAFEEAKEIIYDWCGMADELYKVIDQSGQAWIDAHLVINHSRRAMQWINTWKENIR